MLFRIRDLLGIERAELRIEPGKLTEVTGLNASGKTSIAVCLQALLARDVNPLGLSAADAKRAYGHHGNSDGYATLELPEGDLTWRAAAGTIAGPPGGSLSAPEAVGLVDFTSKRSAKERAELFWSILLPPFEEVLGATKEALAAYMPPTDVSGVIEMLRERGWYPTESVFTERARDAKRQWRDVTTRIYGSKVAEDWRPDGWLADYDRLTVERAEELVTVARESLFVLHQEHAISATDAQRAEEASGQIPGLRIKSEELSVSLREAEGELEARASALRGANIDIAEAEKAYRAAASLADRHSTPLMCPHCSGAVVIVQDGGVRLSAVDEAAQQARKSLAGLSETLGQAQSSASRRREEEREATEARAGVKKRLDAARWQLTRAEEDAARSGPVETEERISAIASVESELEDAKRVVELVRARRDAARLHETIVRYEAIVKAVGPTGVRTRMLERGEARLNAGLRVLSEESGWPATLVERGGVIFVGSRPVALCSESERWRAQAALQLTLAALSGSKVVVMDRADMLDAEGRAGLAKAIQRVANKLSISVVVCSTETGEALEGFETVLLKNGRTEDA